MVDTILFDFYGTLAVYSDLETGNRRSCEHIYDRIRDGGSGLGFADFLRCWEREVERHVPPGEMTEPTVFLTKIASVGRTCGAALSPAAVRETGERCLEIWHELIRFPDDLRAVLVALRQMFALGLVSNFDHPPYLRGVLRRLDIEGLFETVVISGEAGVRKPSCEIFRRALTGMSADPRRTVFVGDSLREDIAGAAAAGCLPVLIDRQGRHPEYAGLRIREVSDLCTLGLRALEGGPDGWPDRDP
jgi:HAD superfamily hydrolase (TIGR01509 family)